MGRPVSLICDQNRIVIFKNVQNKWDMRLEEQIEREMLI